MYMWNTHPCNSLRKWTGGTSRYLSRHSAYASEIIAMSMLSTTKTARATKTMNKKGPVNGFAPQCFNRLPSFSYNTTDPCKNALVATARNWNHREEIATMYTQFAPMFENHEVYHQIPWHGIAWNQNWQWQIPQGNHWRLLLTLPGSHSSQQTSAHTWSVKQINMNYWIDHTRVSWLTYERYAIIYRNVWRFSVQQQHKIRRFYESISI